VRARAAALAVAAGLLASPCAGEGREAAAFLDLPAGGRSTGMGGAVVALPSDAFGFLANPAGLAGLGRAQAGVQHAVYVEDVAFEHLSLGVPFGGSQGLGVAAQYFGSSNLDRTDEAGVEGGTFKSYYALAGLSYAFRAGRTSFGATGKHLQGRLDTLKAETWAFDAGILHHLGRRLSLGAAVTDVGRGLRFESREDPLPTTWVVGAALRPAAGLRLAVDGVRGRDGATDGRFGLEWRALEAVALRGGYRTDGSKGGEGVEGVTAGLGLLLERQEIAYAWLPLGRLGNTHYFSLLWRFGEDWGEEAAEEELAWAPATDASAPTASSAPMAFRHASRSSPAR
jgi:hypothetical protein